MLLSDSRETPVSTSIETRGEDMETGILVPALEYQTGPGHLNMQCGTEAEIKERHRQTERWVGGGWVYWGGYKETEREDEKRGSDGERALSLLFFTSLGGHVNEVSTVESINCSTQVLV
ncbi:hypothetical protein PAMP_003727 [Pampus punctatissimus]